MLKSKDYIYKSILLDYCCIITNKLSKTTSIFFFKDFRYFNASPNNLKLEHILKNVILKLLGDALCNCNYKLGFYSNVF